MRFYEAPELYLLMEPSAGHGYLEGHYAYPMDWGEWAGPAIPETLMVEYSSGDALSEVAGRACYWSYGKGRKTNSDYIRNIVESGHGSVLEHPSWTFGVKGISRSLSHELVRHRHLSFSQLSQRYHVEEGEFVIPPGLPPELHDEFKDNCEVAFIKYKQLVEQLPDAKRGREVARALLPNATATRIVVSGNARSLRSMLALRGSLHADAEFRRLAILWTKEMKRLSPNIFADFEIREEAGAEYVWAEFPKV